MSERENDTSLETVMALIVNGGNAKSSAFEAIASAKIGHFQEAETKLNEADKFLSQAHQSQTGMLTNEAQGNHVPVTLLMVHSQDHLMNAITFRDLAGEIVALYKRLHEMTKIDSDSH